MRILLVAPGISIHTQRFLKKLLSIGHSITLLDTNNPILEDLPQYKFIPFPNPPQITHHPIPGFYRLGLLFTSLQLRQIYSNVKPDVVHVHWVDKRSYDVAFAHLHPLVLTCWGADINNLYENPIIDQEHRNRTIYALSAADHITADSSEILERCQNLVGQPLPTSIFYFGIDFDKFSPGYQDERLNWREQHNIDPDVPVFLSVRRPVRQMGHDYILRAFANLATKVNNQAILVFIRFLAKNSDYENELNQMARELGILKNVLWIDGVEYEKLPVLYAAIDYVVNYPLHDGLPVSLFEATACKKLVITANLNAYKDILSQGDFIAIPPQDVEALTTALVNVMSIHQEEAWNQIEKNYILVKRIADERECYRKLEQTYATLINAHRK